jgi:hypothetical protein
MSDWCLEHPVMTFLLAWITIGSVRHIGMAVADAVKARRERK